MTMTGAAHHRHRSRQDYATPWELARAVERRFGAIAWDLAASADNARAAQWIGEDRNSLSVAWHELGEGLLWLNPPFARIAPWAAKCAQEAALGARIALLVPAAVDACWFADHVLGRALVLALNPRVSFDGRNPYPKGVMLCVFGERADFGQWRWRA